MPSSVKRIVILGNSLAAQTAALALSARLPANIKLTLVSPKAPSSLDMFYGGITSPSAYEFFLSFGITEPELFLSTHSSVSLGTQYRNWGADQRNWTQSWHRPLPTHHGVQFHHYVNRYAPANQTLSLDPYIMSVVAANRGVFAHPPEGQNIPLAAVEYGYHFAVSELSKLLRSKADNTKLDVVEAEIDDFTQENNVVHSAKLSNGHVIDGDFFIDCRGQDSGNDWAGSRTITGITVSQSTDKLDSLVRTITATNEGVTLDIPLREHNQTLHLCDSENRQSLSPLDGTPLNLTIGRNDNPWTGNTLNFGLRAGAVDPLTAAPMMLLQADIERLLELIPVSSDMQVEAREYNRRFKRDFDNAYMFNRALFGAQTDRAAPYFKSACANDMPPELTAKITQFQNRGICVTYDNELFSESEWVSLHLGMGRRPVRYDLLTDRVPDGQIKSMLENMSQANIQMGQKLPPIGIYMSKFLTFLKEKHG